MHCCLFIHIIMSSMAVLCRVGHLAGSHLMPVAPSPPYSDQCLQTFLKVPWGTKSPLVENHRLNPRSHNFSPTFFGKFYSFQFWIYIDDPFWGFLHLAWKMNSSSCFFCTRIFKCSSTIWFKKILQSLNCLYTFIKNSSRYICQFISVLSCIPWFYLSVNINTKLSLLL